MDVSKLKIPSHVAMIMDGNGRWAKQFGKERIEGHYEGVVSVRSAIETSLDLGVQYLTIYAFSTENWERPKSEVDGLMELFSKTIALEIPSLIEQQVKVIFVGDLDGLNSDVRKSVEFCHSKTEQYNRLTLCVALNYGAKAEIVSAVKTLASKVASGELKVDEISEDMVSGSMYRPEIPPIDLLIRTSGEQRISNFMLWQAAYSEFYFTPTLWPEFREQEYIEAINEYTRRDRRFGKVNEG